MTLLFQADEKTKKATPPVATPATRSKCHAAALTCIRSVFLIIKKDMLVQCMFPRSVQSALM